MELKRGQDLRIGSQNKKQNQIIWKKKFGQVGEKTKGLGRENPLLGGHRERRLTRTVKEVEIGFIIVVR